MTTRNIVKADAVILLSGGLDSSVLLRLLRRERPSARLYAISFLYGQKHKRELACARWQAQAASVAEHQTPDIRDFGAALANDSALTDCIRPIPSLAELAQQDLDQPPTYVPHRNLVLLSMAAAYAESRGCAEVCYGAQRQEQYGYWDCTPDFVKHLNQVLALNRRTPVHVYAPFTGLRKADVLKIGLEVGVDFSHTWSCYRGNERACGVCPACMERLAAFREIGVADSLPYDD